MKNKLLLTTALAGSLMFAGSAMSETKITGGMDISLTGSSDDAAGGAASGSGMGSETQLNISKSGDLNNGMSYAAGFSMESDTGVDAHENMYIDINLAEGTKLSFGSDHFPALDGTITPLVSIAADTAAQGATGANNETVTGLAYYNGSRIDAVESHGAGIIQDLGGIGSARIYYAPDVGNTGSSTGNDGVPSETNSAWHYAFSGNLGVEGLNVLIGQEKSDSISTLKDRKGTNYGISYNFGQIAVGASKVKNELSTGADADSKEAGITFAVNDNFSLGLSRFDTDLSTAANDEEITMVQAGYNLGGINTSVSYAQVENRAGGATDEDFFNVRIGTKF
jgi:hypothetical protein